MRDQVREGLKEALLALKECQVCMHEWARLDNTLWDSEHSKCYIVDFTDARLREAHNEHEGWYAEKTWETVFKDWGIDEARIPHYEEYYRRPR
ncbi:hypothetical protein CC80DRAFT_493133 [Byssothecium circinans]|uniref:Aminoglycoside phosphotransferase domain-containing protein n=1 Tax=Byssothecium circinans TaxID=147558 RepID=A0A6A5TT66_9PLEO|nr:hypothetical protein CC80DRAFT_493133 [Byssothecium circinans]